MREWADEIRERIEGSGMDGVREAAVVEELAQHLADRFDELRSGGMTEADARSAALEELDGDGVLGPQLRRAMETSRSEPPPRSPAICRRAGRRAWTH